MVSKVSTHLSPNDGSVIVSAHIDPMSVVERYIGPEIIHLIADKIAEKYVQDHYSEIAAKLDQNAIASLAIAEAGKKIAEEIRSKPTVLHDTRVETKVYQRSLLGGLHRIS